MRPCCLHARTPRTSATNHTCRIQTRSRRTPSTCRMSSTHTHTDVVGNCPGYYVTNWALVMNNMSGGDDDDADEDYNDHDASNRIYINYKEQLTSAMQCTSQSVTRVRALRTCEHSEHVKSPYINHIKTPVLLSMYVCMYVCAFAWMTNTVGIHVFAGAFIERMCHGTHTDTHAGHLLQASAQMSSKTAGFPIRCSIETHRTCVSDPKRSDTVCHCVQNVQRLAPVFGHAWFPRAG